MYGTESHKLGSRLDSHAQSGARFVHGSACRDFIEISPLEQLAGNHPCHFHDIGVQLSRKYEGQDQSCQTSPH